MRIPLTLSLLLGINAALSLGPAAGQGATDPTLPNQLTVTDLQVGNGRELHDGMFVVLHYTGWVYDPSAPEKKGRQFVNSRERGEPLSYLYGYGRAVKGLERGMEGMKVGGKRTIVIPPKLGYDGFKYPNPPEVPKGSALVFYVELLDVVPQGAPPDE
jgi:FKBP-type peptidyl-prolyl cis-trans isomerase FkpA